MRPATRPSHRPCPERQHRCPARRGDDTVAEEQGEAERLHDPHREVLDGEREVFDVPRKETVREILSVKQDVTALRRISAPQRDAVGRLARREFPMIPEELTFRFRDVYDNLVRIADEGLIFQDRITSLLDAHFSNVSNRLNEIMRVLTVLTVIVAPRE